MASAAAIVEKPSPPGYNGLDRMPIGESWRSGCSNQRARDVDPYTGDTLLELTSANAQDIDEAHAADRAARAQGFADARQ